MVCHNFVKLFRRCTFKIQNNTTVQQQMYVLCKVVLGHGVPMDGRERKVTLAEVVDQAIQEPEESLEFVVRRVFQDVLVAMVQREGLDHQDGLEKKVFLVLL